MPLTKTLTLDDLFQRLLHYRDQTNNPSKLLPWLTQHIHACSLPQLDQFPLHANAYSRTCIAKESLERPQSFEALVMRWDKCVETSIHGHPDFAFYYVISGRFKMDFFSHNPTEGLQRTGMHHYNASDTVCFLGPAGCYDNTIHRVTCLEPGLTFHIYSEDAQKGCCYELPCDR